jgi:hypothetical protein
VRRPGSVFWAARIASALRPRSDIAQSPRLVVHTRPWAWASTSTMRASSLLSPSRSASSSVDTLRFGKGPQHILQLNQPAIHFRYHQDTTTIPARARTACMSTRRRVDPVRAGHPPTRLRPAQGLSSRSRAPNGEREIWPIQRRLRNRRRKREQSRQAEAAEGIHGAPPPPTTTASAGLRAVCWSSSVADDPAIPVAAVTFPWTAKWHDSFPRTYALHEPRRGPRSDFSVGPRRPEGDPDGPLS